MKATATNVRGARFSAPSPAETANGLRSVNISARFPKDEVRPLTTHAARLRAGVTLIEMLVVMVVIGLMAAISYPAASAGIDSIRINTASQSVAAFLNAALTRVDRRQEPLELIISSGGNTIRSVSNDSASARHLTLPEGVSIETVLPEQPGADSPERRVILLPGATAPGIGIQIANRRGARRIIRLDPATGFPRIESVLPR